MHFSLFDRAMAPELDRIVGEIATLETTPPDEHPTRGPEDQNNFLAARVSSRSAEVVLRVAHTDIARPVEAQQT